MKRWHIIAPLIALAAVALSLINASWIAGTPAGHLVVVANRGIVHPVREGAAGPCAAVQIEPTELRMIENTIPSLRRAIVRGAQAVAVDVRRTADGRMVAFRDETLDCRTDGTGPVSARTLGELKRLDAGHDYTPDGAAFPLRAWGRGAIPSVEEILYAFPYERIVFLMRGSDPADAEALAAEFARAGVALDQERFGFLGAEPVLARLRTLAPKGWTFTREASEACLGDYRLGGWIGIVPESCEGAVVALQPGPNWTVWGWPYRFLARLQGAGGQAMLVESFGDDGLPVGLTTTELVEDVPGDFRGFLWIDDMERVGAQIAR